ncbi:MAG: hemagglutinin [Dialister invisus]|uniref:ESPR-type extended signal peptide-containing protein n=2 Tax=Dialister invisus TaxID=218538 RepID=UPI0013F6D588|nr:ESPR-type extended signal peptide-containing protein [Dialister invisus]MUU09943.1 hemagglutinin [Dialister invisus]
MNQIYKVIWSRVKHCYVVVSEIAGRCGKNGGTASEKKSMPVRAFLCALAITGCLLPGMAGASFHGGIGATTATANSIAVGDDAKTTEEYTIALGSRSRAINIYAIAMGDQAQATGQGATAIGSLSKSTAEHSLAVGDQAEAAAVNSSAYGILSKALSSHSVAIGNGASVGKGDPDSVSSQNGIAIGNGANVTVNPATATPGITDKSGGIAIGHDATTKDINTIALGTGTIGQGAQAVAIGRNARTIANNGVAIGNEARTQSTNGFALGNNARAGFDENNVLVGNDNDQAFGSNARAWGGSSMAFGNNAKAANGGAIAMGNGSQSRGDWGVAIGNGAKALAAGARALGANSNASGVNAAAIGWDSEASGASSIAVGETVKSTGTNSVAIGTGAKAANENAIALGAGSETAAAVATPSATINGTAHNFAGVNPASTVSVGKAGSERTITNVAAGRISAASTDAINGSQLYAVTSEIDKGVAYAGDVKGAGAAANKFTRKLGEQTNIVGGVADTSKLTDGNIGVVSNGTDTLNIKLAKNVKVDSVTTGNTVINNNGLTVGGKTYVTNNGINANNQTITNVASGGNTTTNAANIGDVQTAVNNAVTNVTNTLTAKGLDFEGNDGAANKVHRDLGTKLTVKGGLADVTTGVSGKNLGVKKNAAGDGLDLVMSEKPEFKEVTAGTGTNKVVINDNGVHVGGKTYINNSGLNANNQKITNVATGTAGTDAVNVDQLNAAIGGTAKATTVKAKDANVTVTKGTSAETGGREYTVGLGNVVTVGQTHPVTVNGDAGTVNGLTNTTWDIDNPTVVHGQAATEDQLKTVSDGVKTNKTNITKNANDITNINTTIGKGLNFGGDSGADINKKLGDKLEIKGGASADLTDGNIGVVSDGAKLNVKLKKDVDLGPNGSLTINGKTYVNKDGLNANNQKITNVATGTAGTDAVNVDQLNAAIGGTAKATTVKAKDANVTVTEGTNAAGGKEFTVGLGNVVTVGQTHPVTVNGDAGTVNGLTNTTWDIDNPTVVHGQAATEDQLKTVSDGVKTNKTNITKNANDITNINTTIGKGLNFKGDDATVINKKLGEQLEIKGGADASKLSDGNIGVVSGNGALNIKLAKNVKVDSVTTGNTVINNNGLTVGGKTYVTNNGLNANNQKSTNVTDGQVAAGSKDAVNGGQLHDAKNEVINKGLRFDADNNSEKTNKLGSKVTVNGDNNITTEITQTGDDTKIGVKLNKDIHVKTVTATDTVKAGGVTMGSQTSGGTTGNYVTGLDNKTWNVTNPTAVSGRAATEDQLKTVTEAINNQSAAATDYRLVQNASSADGSYTVDTNGNIDLTVQDKNHTDKTETVKLKDIASKSKLDDVIAKGLQFDANAGGTKTNKLGSKITVKGEGTAADTEYSGENLKTFITQDPAGNTTIDVKMNKNLKVETIVATGENGKDGKIGINGKDGVTTNISVTRDGKPGVDGAPGTTTTRIVYEKPDGTKEEVATLNDGMKYGGDTGNVIKKKLNEQVNVVGGITDENKLTTEDNLGVVSDGSNNLKVRLAKALKGLESVTTGDTVMNNNGVTINNGAAGNTVSLTKNGLDNGGNKITNVAAGDVSANSTDAVNGSQLHDVKTLAGQHTTVKAKDSNITVTEGTNGTGGKEYTVGLGDKVTLGTDPSKQVSIDGTTGIIKAGDKVTIDGTTGNIDAGKVKINGKDGTVNGLTNKTWDPNNITSGQAATEDQLKAVDQKITNTSEELTKKGMDFAGNDGEFHRNLGDKVTIKGEGTKAASEYSGENIKTFADANGNLTVKMDKNLKTETIVATGKNGKDGKIGINGKDGVTTNISVTRDGKPGRRAPGTTTTRIVYEKPDGTKEEVATLNDGMKYGGDTGNVIKKKLNEQVNVVGGITDTNKLTTEDNLGVVSDGNNNLKVRMAKDLKGLNSVTTNTLTVGDVKIDNSGINAGNKKITNVAAGDISANSTDAVNGGQLWKTNQTINNIGGAVNELGDRMDRVGAGAAALAALHPLDFDPDDKWDVAAGYGNYKDAHAVAVGAFYRPNEDTMFSVGGSFGGGENMVNAGVSVKLGQGNHVSTSKVAMAKEIVDLRDENKDLKKRLDTMEQKMNSILGILDMGKKKDFPDVPENHWAYEYVSTLAGNGILEGYPDGMFSGERSMTRYEFAAMFYRALKNGAPVDDNMDRAMNEFEPELRQIRLDRIRVDRISGKDNDRNKVERVRVNSEDDKANNDYRDVYGSHISPEA